MWYAAHAVIAIRLKENAQSEFPAWENIFLVEATSEEEAWSKAEVRAREDEGDYGLTWNDQPAEYVFWGLRKLVKCYSENEQPIHGTEITHNHLCFADQINLDAFVAGKEASALFFDENPED